MVQAYEVVKTEPLDLLGVEGTLLRHKKTGARVVIIPNDDENKVFNIAFRTPPKNSTGVAHIIEHTVLCGSRKFPLKDPFVELAKGSLNTFLNAMTYPDKTMFPVASCNDTDFQNLMDVYLDAVFYPNIYKTEKIFRQEGWHYQMETAEDPLTYNGVVYNEMKGAFSSADDVLERTVFNALFPDTPYGVESGGDPDVIPELSYEEFLAFHKKYYHPSNSYIYLYGDMDMDEKLDWLDREYLSAFDKITVDSEITEQKPFAEPIKIDMTYPILDDEPEEDNTYLTTNMVVGDYRDVTLNMGMSVLEYVLLGAPGAPVKQALLDAGICQDADGSYGDGIRQPMFSITIKKSNPEQLDRFLQIVNDTLSDLAENGIDRKAIASGINYFEFRLREADFGTYPRGLIYGIDLFDSWLYDDENPFAYLNELAVVEDLKKKAEEGYFESLIKKYLLSNPHAAIVTLRPEKGLAAKRDAQLAEALAAKKAAMTQEEIETIVRETKELKEYQESEDTAEDLATLPLLHREDIAKESPWKLRTKELAAGDVTILHQQYPTNGIAYLQLLFDISKVPNDLVPYIGVLASVLGNVNTENYTYGQLFHEVNANTGGLRFAPVSFSVDKGADSSRGKTMFAVKSKYLYPKRDFVFDMIIEILRTSKTDDTKRLLEILSENKIGMQHRIPASGHSSSALRALTYISKMSAWSDTISGIGQYRLIERLANHFDEEKEDLISKLQQLVHIVFRPENLIVSVTADQEGMEGIAESVQKLCAELYTDDVPTGSFEWKAESKNEGFKTSGQVQYVAYAGNFKKAGIDYTGAFRILRVILNYDYLWMNLRVLGGAYGCMSAFKRSGDAYFVSYRDPHLTRTLDIYRGLPDYLKAFDADERTMTKYVIGAISGMDTPLNASAKGELALGCWFSGITEDDFRKEREEVLTAGAEQIRDLAKAAEAILSEENICVIGTETAIEKHSEVFKVVKPLVEN